jgi:hypothetical protein
VQLDSPVTPSHLISATALATNFPSCDPPHTKAEQKVSFWMTDIASQQDHLLIQKSAGITHKTA